MRLPNFRKFIDFPFFSPWHQVGGPYFRFITSKMTEAGENPMDFVNKKISDNKVVVFSKTWCPYCSKVKTIFEDSQVSFESVELDLLEEFGVEIQQSLFEKTKQKTVPNVFINGQHVGGCSDIETAKKNGKLAKLLFGKINEFQYDVLVIGGGSGGIAAAKEAARLGQKVALCDFVQPSPLGTTWGLGGTCVNVGCIPKKLMHRASLIHEDIKNAPAFGWKVPEDVPHDWGTMVSSVQSHIRSLNWGYRKDMKSMGISYFNAFARFYDKNTIEMTNNNGDRSKITAENIIIAVGCRPRYPETPGVREYCLSSDDLFSLSYNPGKTLVVGASYVALECACFLKGIDIDTSVMVRSIILRGFDRGMANRVKTNMEKKNISFINECVLSSVKMLKSGSKTEAPELEIKGVFQDGSEYCDTFNTVLIAIGRYPVTKGLNLEQAGVKMNKEGKIIVNDLDQTNVPSIYAIGDVAEGRPELTPVAILAGKLLARRLSMNSESPKMDYSNIPSTVFTSLEYGCVGESEETAYEKYKENVIVYHDVFKPLEEVLNEDPLQCYVKLICIKENGEEKVVGLHVLGPNAGEITQGFALAVKIGVSKNQFDNLVGIHPTCAEVFTTLTITTASGEELSDSKGC